MTNQYFISRISDQLYNIVAGILVINNRAVPASDLALIPHQGQGFLYVRFLLADGMLRDGANEVGFSLVDGATGENGEVVIQEMEIRVVPI